MSKKLKNQIAFYADNGEGLLDELVIDIAERRYEYNGNVDARELWQVHNRGAKEICVEPTMLDAILDWVGGEFSGSFSWNEESYEARRKENRQIERRERARPVVPKEKIWQAIKWELDQDELNELLSYEKYQYEKAEYYDFDLMLEKIQAFIAGERTVDYFTSWCILLVRCFQEAMNDRSRKRQAIYGNISELFDGIAFMGQDISEQEKGKDCRELIAYLKYYNHQIVDSRNGQTTPFMKNGVVVYVTLDFSANDGKDCLYRVCVADHERKTVNYFLALNLDYNVEINYTLQTCGEFEELQSDYFKYRLDTAMTEDYPLRKVKNPQ